MNTTPAPAADAQHHGYHADKDALARRLKRIEGQVRGVAKMIDEDKYCIDILTQVSAINAALHKVSVQLVEDHIGHCVVDAAKTSMETGDESYVNDKVTEASAAIARLVR
ncbi:metal-sensitive transcriptional regulator [Glutamicibacter soli]